METFRGFHSEWNLGSPGGWDYQRITQEIAQIVWQELNRMVPMDIELMFDHPLLHPVVGFTDMLVETMRHRSGVNSGVIAVVAEEETLENVTENINLAERLDRIEGITGILAAPQEFDLINGKVCHNGREVGLIFMDFNNDVLLKLHRKYNLSAVLKAVEENRVINPRGTEPINVKSMFEVITGTHRNLFQRQTVARTPWTRRFFHRKTSGPNDESIKDLVEWTRQNWKQLVLKPERGYSGIGVRVGGQTSNPDEAISLALEEKNYIVQAKVPLSLWGEVIPEIDSQLKQTALVQRQTDFRCLLGPAQVFGFLGRYGNVPTNVGSGGGVHPLAVLKSKMSVREAAMQLNDALLGLGYEKLSLLDALQKQLAIDRKFTYLLGPIKIALRPRLITEAQLRELDVYCAAMWTDCLLLEKMWNQGALDAYIDIEEEELAIARLQPWEGGPAIFAADGLFDFGAHLEAP